MARAQSTKADSGSSKWLHPTLFAAFAALMVGSTTDARSNEQVVRAKASDPAATVRLLTAPHTGQTICEIADATPLIFFKRANHGPHRFANVEVAEGTCVGKEGYVPWGALDPEPQDD